MTGATPAWVGRAMRLDPTTLPARYMVPTGGSGDDAAVYLDDRGVVVKRRLSGLPLTLSLPISAYDGIAVRLTTGADGSLSAAVELVHRDPALTLPLAVTHDMDEAAADWALWSERLALPMVLVETDGRHTIVRPTATVPIGPPQPRRRTGLLTKRRPRFLVRRRTGHSRPMPVMSGWREIIARA